MPRFHQDIYLASGLPTPFGRGGGALAGYDAISLSVPIVQAMAKQLDGQKPDLVVWGHRHSEPGLDREAAGLGYRRNRYPMQRPRAHGFDRPSYPVPRA
jgi:hypothetical protein